LICLKLRIVDNIEIKERNALNNQHVDLNRRVEVVVCVGRMYASPIRPQKMNALKHSMARVSGIRNILNVPKKKLLPQRRKDLRIGVIIEMEPREYSFPTLARQLSIEGTESP
jgi:hypothetical protein